MRIITTFAVAAALSVSAIAASAGSMDDAVVEPTVDLPAPTVAPEASSVSSGNLVGIAFAGLLAAAAIAASQR